MAVDALALSVQGLHAHYGASHILHGVDLDVPLGATVGLVGRNGVGKTTLVNTVLGIVPSTEGCVQVFGSDITNWATHRIARAGVQIVPQGRRLFPSLTVNEHLSLAVRRGSGGRDIEWAFDRFPALKERGSSYARTLSGGEQSQLSIARAALADPRLILMDEPTEGLAPLIVAEVGDLIRLLAEEGVSVLLVEQNLRFALGLCDTVAVMSRGRIVHHESTGSIGDLDTFAERFMGIEPEIGSGAALGAASGADWDRPSAT